MTAPMCPVHAVAGELVDDAYLYGRSYGRVWKCPVVACDYRVGAHKDSGEPKGTMANHPLREARKRAHRVFDGWWQADGVPRKDAYRLLREQTGVAHIAEATIEECERIVQAFMRPLMGAGVRLRRERRDER